MNKKPIVSVITITYKHEKYILDTIQGVLNQKTDFDIEHIIGDDKSPDETEKVVKDFLAENTKSNIVKYTRHKENKGINLNFIWCLEQAKGKYIAMCEGDDYWTDPYKLQKQIDLLESKPDLAMCTHEASHVSTLTNHKNVRRLLSIFKSDIQLHGFSRIPTLLKLLLLNQEKFWLQKRTHDKLERKTINTLEDFKNNTWYMPFCSIVVQKKIIEDLIDCYYCSSGAHQLTLLMGAMRGGIYHFKDIMAVKRDQESSVSKNKERKNKLKEKNLDINKNEKINRLKALQKHTKNENDNSIIQNLINIELGKIKKYNN